MTDHDHGPERIDQAHPVKPERQVPPDDLDPALLDAALDAMRRYSEAGRGYGTAFFAYLSADFGLDPEADEEADFRARYVGRFEDRSSFVRDRIDAHGWGRAVAEFTASQGMWPGDLQWDEAVLLEHLALQYALVERDGSFYAFRI